jgi:hypothetical protein
MEEKMRLRNYDGPCRVPGNKEHTETKGGRQVQKNKGLMLGIP